MSKKKSAALRSTSSSAASQPLNRFRAFTPGEREVLRILLQEHLNAIGEISINLPDDVRIHCYLAPIEELGREAREA